MGSHRKASWQREHVVEEGSLDIFNLFCFSFKISTVDTTHYSYIFCSVVERLEPVWVLEARMFLSGC